MKGKDLAYSRHQNRWHPNRITPQLGFDRVFLLSGTICAVLAWFVWHLIFDLILQIILGMFVMRLWFKNIRLKRHLSKLEKTINRA